MTEMKERQLTKSERSEETVSHLHKLLFCI